MCNNYITQKNFYLHFDMLLWLFISFSWAKFLCCIEAITAKLSSQYYGSYDYGPAKAIDGFTGASWNSLVVSSEEVSPWIQLDLAIDYCIHSVTIFDRAFGVSHGNLLWLTTTWIRNLLAVYYENNLSFFQKKLKNCYWLFYNHIKFLYLLLFLMSTAIYFSQL